MTNLPLPFCGAIWDAANPVEPWFFIPHDSRKIPKSRTIPANLKPQLLCFQHAEVVCPSVSWLGRKRSRVQIPAARTTYPADFRIIIFPSSDFALTFGKSRALDLQKVPFLVLRSG
jgi:hypothetical protein